MVRERVRRLKDDTRIREEDRIDFWNLNESEKIRQIWDPLSYLEPSPASTDVVMVGSAAAQSSLYLFLSPYLPNWALEWVDWGRSGSQKADSETDRLKKELERVKAKLARMEEEMQTKKMESQLRQKEIEKLVQTIRLLQDHAGAWAAEMGMPREMFGDPPLGIEGKGVQIEGLTEEGAKDILMKLANQKSAEVGSLTRTLFAERGKLGLAKRALGFVERDERAARKILKNFREDDPLDTKEETRGARQNLAGLQESLRISKSSVQTQMREVNKTRGALALAKKQLSRLQEIANDEDGAGAINALQAVVAGAGAEAGGAVAEFLLSTPAADLPSILKENLWSGGLNLKSATSTIWRASSSLGYKLGEKRIVELQEVLRQLQDVYSSAYVLLSKAGLDGKGAKNMGWLKVEESLGNLPKTTDGTERFYELMEREGVQMPREYSYLLVPGLLWEIYKGYFTPLEATLLDRGYKAAISNVSGTGPIESNIKVLSKEIRSMYNKHEKPVILIGHSKGGVDSAATLACMPSLRPLVGGLVTVQSPYAGACLAQEAIEDSELREVLRGWIEDYLNGDMKSVTDLAYSNRMKFLQSHPFPDSVKVASLHSTTAGASSTMLPLAAYHTRRYDVSTDGLVVPIDAEVPGAVVVRYKEDLPHTAPVWKIQKDKVQPSQSGVSLEEWELEADFFKTSEEAFAGIGSGPNQGFGTKDNENQAVFDGIESEKSKQKVGPTSSALRVGRQLVRLETLLMRVFNPGFQQFDLYKLYAALVVMMLEHVPPAQSADMKVRATSAMSESEKDSDPKHGNSAED